MLWPMKSLPLPVLLAALVGAIALPVDTVAGGTLLLIAGMGAIIRLDYACRYRGLRLPRRRILAAQAKFRPLARPVEANQLAA